jgi:hypothetical protein
VRYGFSPKTRQILSMEDCESPTVSDMSRVIQRVAVLGLRLDSVILRFILGRTSRALMARLSQLYVRDKDLP